MKSIVANLLLNLVAYTDTAVGFYLRCYMVKPVAEFDEQLAAYIALFVHF